MEANALSPAHSSEILIDYPEPADLHLRISIGACRLRISPASSIEAPWVKGSYDDPTGSVPYTLKQQGGLVRIAQQHGIGTLKSAFSGLPSMNLELGNKNPFGLSIETGGSDVAIDLGGLPILLLALKAGAGKVMIDFSSPNTEEMEKLDVDAGAVSLVLKGLANANFSRMRLNGGAASYELDFSGDLRREATADINAGVSSVKVSVPAGTAAKINPGSVMGGLDIGDGFMKREGAFWTEAAVAAQHPVISIQAAVSLGSLALIVT